jgi:hypothetical protein
LRKEVPRLIPEPTGRHPECCPVGAFMETR